MNIIFWLDFPSFHVSPLIKQLSKDSALKVAVITEKKIPNWRLDMGFTLPDFGDADHHNAPCTNARNELIRRYTDSDSVHIFYGIRSTPNNLKAFNFLADKDCLKGFYLEPRDLARSLKSYLRLGFYKLFFYRYKNKINFLLATGELGVNFYRTANFPERKLYEFGYYLPLSTLSKAYINKATQRLNNNEVQRKCVRRVIYVGQLNENKNVMLLLEACKKLQENSINFYLTIIGEGVLFESLASYVKENFLSEKITFSNYLPKHDVLKAINEHDLLVLPSRYDGWGAVASEALSCGVPILVSDRCGASTMARKNKIVGKVFKSNNLESLYFSLESMLLDDNFFSDNAMFLRKQFFQSNWSDKAGVERLLSIIELSNQ